MSKGYAAEFLAVYEAILRDYLSAYPADRKQVERDLSRLRLCVEARGFSVFTLDFPALGKHFDRCLADGRLTLSHLALARGSRKSPLIPRLFSGMMVRVFDANGCLRQDPDITVIAFLRQLYNCGKKFDMDCPRGKVILAVREFIEIESSLPNPTLNWDEDSLRAFNPAELSFVQEDGNDPQIDLFEEDLVEDDEDTIKALQYLHEVGDIVAAEIGRWDYSDLLPKHGPGAVSDQRKGGNKYWFPCWPEKLDRVFPASEFGVANFSHWLDTRDSGRGFSDHEPPSRLIAVPKTQKGPRLIAKEPIAHQWMQQAVARFLEKRIWDSSVMASIDIRNQGWSRDRAVKASLDGLHWTIDLSSASDRVTCWLVERLFRRNNSLLDAFHACRTRWLIQTLDKKEAPAYRLRKFSTQGSALTFPVETLVFTMISIAALLFEEKRKVTTASIKAASRRITTFGDDMIVPNVAGLRTVSMLHRLHLKVNISKTFGNGKFRESCGMDAYNGSDVTPVYIRKLPVRGKPESIVSYCELIRNLEKRKLYGLADYARSRALKDPSFAGIPCVAIGSGAFGIPSPYGLDTRGAKLRTNPRTGVREAYIRTTVSRAYATPNEGSTGLLQYFISEARRREPPSSWRRIRRVSDTEIVQKSSQRLMRRWVPIQNLI